MSKLGWLGSTGTCWLCRVLWCGCTPSARSSVLAAAVPREAWVVSWGWADLPWHTPALAHTSHAAHRQGMEAAEQPHCLCHGSSSCSCSTRITEDVPVARSLMIIRRGQPRAASGSPSWAAPAPALEIFPLPDFAHVTQMSLLSQLTTYQRVIKFWSYLRFFFFFLEVKWASVGRRFWEWNRKAWAWSSGLRSTCGPGLCLLLPLSSATSFPHQPGHVLKHFTPSTMNIPVS